MRTKCIIQNLVTHTHTHIQTKTHTPTQTNIATNTNIWIYAYIPPHSHKEAGSSCNNYFSHRWQHL